MISSVPPRPAALPDIDAPGAIVEFPQEQPRADGSEVHVGRLWSDEPDPRFTHVEIGDPEIGTVQYGSSPLFASFQPGDAVRVTGTYTGRFTVDGLGVYDAAGVQAYSGEALLHPPYPSVTLPSIGFGSDPVPVPVHFRDGKQVAGPLASGD